MNNTCRSNDDITNTIMTSNFVMKYITSTLNPFDYETPIEGKVADYFQPLHYGKNISMFLYFSSLEILNKPINQFVDIQNKVNNGIVFASEKYSSRDRDKNSLEEFFTLNMFLDTSEKHMYRTYTVWTDILSYLGGYFTCVKVLINILLLRFVRAALMQRVSNEIYDYKEIIDNMEKQVENNNPNPSEITSKHYILKISLWDYVKSLFYFCKNKKKEKVKKTEKDEIFKKALREMKKKYDISHLLNKVIESEKIQFVLSEKEYKNFRAITKPKLRLTTTMTESISRDFTDRKEKKAFFQKNYNVRDSQKFDDISLSGCSPRNILNTSSNIFQRRKKKSQSESIQIKQNDKEIELKNENEQAKETINEKLSIFHTKNSKIYKTKISFFDENKDININNENSHNLSFGKDLDNIEEETKYPDKSPPMDEIVVEDKIQDDFHIILMEF